MIGYFKLRKKIKELQAELSFKNSELEALHEQLEATLSHGEYKSDEYCRICTYHIQLRSGYFFCSKCDTAPCEHFKLNEELYPLQTQQEQAVK